MCSWDTSEADVDAFVAGGAWPRCSEAENTAGYEAPIGLTADPVVFTLFDGRLCVLLARRLDEPDEGLFALPGGFVGASEAPEVTAERKLREKTGVGSVHLEQLRTYADPARDPRGWLPSIAYLALVRPETLPEESPADREASWHPLDRLPELALDHATIVDDGIWRLHARVGDKVWFVRKALALLTEPFTLRQAQSLVRGAARRGRRRRELPARHARHRVARRHRLHALRRPGPPGPVVPPRLGNTKDPPTGGRLAARHGISGSSCSPRVGGSGARRRACHGGHGVGRHRGARHRREHRRPDRLHPDQRRRADRRLLRRLLRVQVHPAHGRALTGAGHRVRLPVVARP